VRHLSYLAVLAGCLICVAPLAVTVRYALRGKLRRLGLSILVTFIVFTSWDLYAINDHQWTYARASIVGLSLPGRLPIEEALFFLIIPLCMILTFETVQQVLLRPGARRRDQDVR
jgi:lycopene cyclase domain-containing protein